MTRKNLIQTSKFLSYVLRHHPESIDLELDRQGWAYLPALIEKANSSGRNLSEKIVREIIDTGDKRRFALSDDGRYIRAGYGHSIDVELGLEPRQPPEQLYHGTARRNLESIRRDGLRPGGRTMVHLSSNREDAAAVGSRHGKPRVLRIRALELYRKGQ
ncbi:MAG: RNA 2'-phosphotransferase, partial [Balneolaceae bacterium]|nr:RNA 2'-phosphotransferase [Balneolaceae bacterium]